MNHTSKKLGEKDGGGGRGRKDEMDTDVKGWRSWMERWKDVLNG